MSADVLQHEQHQCCGTRHTQSQRGPYPAAGLLEQVGETRSHGLLLLLLLRVSCLLLPSMVQGLRLRHLHHLCQNRMP